MEHTWHAHDTHMVRTWDTNKKFGGNLGTHGPHMDRTWNEEFGGNTRESPSATFACGFSLDFVRFDGSADSPPATFTFLIVVLAGFSRLDGLADSPPATFTAGVCFACR